MAPKFAKYLLAVVFSPIFFSCSEGVRTRDHGTRLTSKDYPNKEERLDVFNKFMSTQTPITDVEFDLFNVNGFEEARTVPGASSWHYRYVLKVDPKDVGAWTDFLPPINRDTTLAWQDSLVSARKAEWAHTSSPAYYGNNGFVTAYRPEGIIFREVGRQ